MRRTTEPPHGPRSREKPLSASVSRKRDAIDTSQLSVLTTRYSAYCRAERFSERTIEAREGTILKLQRFLIQREYAVCGSEQLIEFAGNLRNELTGEELRPWTAVTIYGHLRCFFAWLVEQRILDISPHDSVPRPILRKDQKIPHSTREIQLLLEACRESYYPRRNTAIVRFLVDTGIRASELCNLTFGDLNMTERTVRVLGKGGKVRVLSFGVQTSRSLWSYLAGRDYVPGEKDGEPLFVNEEGKHRKMKMTRRALLLLIVRLAATKGLKSNVHRMRHTFAVNYIINGGDAFSLMLLLGHTDLQTSNIYVALANANLSEKHAKHSPMDNMGF